MRKPILHLPSIAEQQEKVNIVLAQTEKALIGRHVSWEKEDWNDDYTDCQLEDHSGTITGLDCYFVTLLDDSTHQLVRISHHALTSSWSSDREISQLLYKRDEAYRKQHILDDQTEYDIYVLFARRTLKVHYVGFSYDVERRYKQHINLSGNNEAKNAWIQEQQEQGLQPGLYIIETVIGIAYARQREQYWIHAYLRAGYPLTNLDHVGYVESAS
jgi:GIY-YIG catalytic domain